MKTIYKLSILLNIILVAYFSYFYYTNHQKSKYLSISNYFPQKNINPNEVFEIKITFNAKLNPTTIKNNSIEFFPKLNFKIIQENENTLNLKLNSPLKNATKYNIIVSPELRGINGEIPIKEKHELATFPLQIINISQIKIENNETATIGINFNSIVNPLDLKDFLSLRYPDNGYVNYEIIPNKPDKTVLFKIFNLRFDKINLLIKPGLTSTEGELQLEKIYSTDVQLNKKLILYNVTPNYNYYDHSPYVFVEFNSPIDLQTAKQNILIDPKVNFTIDSEYNGFKINGDFEAGKKYKIILKSNLSSGVQTLSEDITRIIWFPDIPNSVKFSFGGGYLSPSNALKIPVQSINENKIKISLKKLYSNNIVEYAIFNNQYMDSILTKDVIEQDFEINAIRNVETETLIDINELTKEPLLGVYYLNVTGDKQWNSDNAVISISDLGISAKTSKNNCSIWVTSISNATPIPDAEVKLYNDHRQLIGTGKTDIFGIANLQINEMPNNENPALIIVSKNSDMNYLSLFDTQRDRFVNSSEGRPYLQVGYEIFAYAERGVYRPNDLVKLSGIIRGKNVEIPNQIPIEISILKSNGRQVFSEIKTSDSYGKIISEYKIPNELMSGKYIVNYKLPGKKSLILGTTSFQISDYIPQTIKLNLATDTTPQTLDTPVIIKANAIHLFGDSAKGLNTKCRVFYWSDFWVPKNYKDYVFGDSRIIIGTKSQFDLDPQILDESGNVEFSATINQMSTPAIIKTRFDVEVIEPGGRAVTESIAKDIFAYKSYLGIKNPNKTMNPKTDYKFELINLFPDETLNTESLNIKITILNVVYSNVLRKSDSGKLKYDWVKNENIIQTLDTKGTFKVNFPNSGRYKIIAETNDACPATMELNVFGTNGQWYSEFPDKLTITLDKQKYAPNDTANIIIKSPFDGIALLTIESDQILESKVINVVNGEASHSIKINGNWYPNVFVSGTLIRKVTPENDWLPHRASGVTRLDIESDENKITLNIDTKNSVKPKEDLDIAITAKNNNNPVQNVSIILSLVDEGVLALTKYQTPNPYDFFYSLKSLSINEYDLYSKLCPILSKWELVKKLDPGGDMSNDDFGRQLNPVISKRIKTVSLYNANLITDQNGIAKIKIPIPEYIGELRIMAVAIKDNKFGAESKPVTVKSPVMARISAPRFLSDKDSFKMPITIYNRTNKNGKFKTLLNLSGPIMLIDKIEDIEIPKNSEKTIFANINASGIGNAQINAQITFGEDSYNEIIELPVRPSWGIINKIETLKINNNEEKIISFDEKYISKTEKNSIVFGGNPIIELSGIAHALLQYPYGCLEQIISKMIPLIYLPDLIKISDPDFISSSEISSMLDEGFTKLLMLQNYNGGLKLWSNESEPSPFASIYAAEFLVEAKKAGFKVPTNLLSSLIQYLNNNIATWIEYKDRDDNYTMLDFAAYDLYVLTKYGEPQYSWTATLQDRITELKKQNKFVSQTSMFYLSSILFMLNQLDDAKLFISENRVSTTNHTTNFINSKIRETSLLLSTLLDIDSKSEQIPALAEQLKQNLKNGCYETTQDNAYAIMALGKYLRLNQNPGLGTVTITFKDNTQKQFDAKCGFKLDNIKSNEPLKITFVGSGSLYCFTYSEGVPINPPKDIEKDIGLKTNKIIYNKDGKTESDINSLKHGELYQISIQIDSTRQIDNALINDMLPAGFEIENSNLCGSAKTNNINSIHTEIRDDRILIFTNIKPGFSDFRYLVRAVTPGTFNLPACETTCLYDAGLVSIKGKNKIKIL